MPYDITTYMSRQNWFKTTVEALIEVKRTNLVYLLNGKLKFFVNKSQFVFCKPMFRVIVDSIYLNMS